ncbi:MAG TPA: lysine--tRNA ligase [bacterium]|nr:lysine--tRNA ligase [bacterium]
MKPIIEQRIVKMKALRAAGTNPYPYKLGVTHRSAEIKVGFDALAAGGAVVTIAGRLMSKRPHGKACFGHIRDQAGDIQAYFKLDDLGEAKFALLGELDIGDIVGVTGTVFKTRTGEITVHASSLELMAKSVRPLPEKWHGLKDKETRYRQRYVDLFVNLDVREVFIKRAVIIACMRDYLNRKGFIEVETPILQPIYGGANASPFTTVHNALDMKLYLRIADELYLKRLLVGGLEKVYEISKDFRNEGMDRTHSPEFTQMELYQAYADYNDIMDLFEDMMEQISLAVLGKTQITYQESAIDLKRPWRRLRVDDALRQFAAIDLAKASDDELRRKCSEVVEADQAGLGRGMLIDEIIDHFVQPRLVEPTLLYDYPVETSPLAKVSRKDPRFAERFEPFVLGIELGNAFSEQNDPVVQRERFEAQRAAAGDSEIDLDFIRALEYGMPPAGGLGVGVDRLVMLLADCHSIRDVMLFPQMRPEAEIEDDIYGL